METIDGRNTLKTWLQDKPLPWTQEIAARAALRSLPLVLNFSGGFPDEPDLLDRDKRSMLQAFRACFTSWVVAFDRTGEMIPDAVALAAAEAVSAAADATVDDDECDADSTAYFAATAAYYAAYAIYAANDVHDIDEFFHALHACESAVDAGYGVYFMHIVFAIGACADDYAQAADAARETGWAAIDADAQWLVEREGEGLMQQPLWLVDLDGESNADANLPVWAHEALDRFNNTEIFGKGPWGLWSDWYHAILPAPRNIKPRSLFGREIDIKIATQKSEFWEHEPDEVMLNISRLVRGEPVDGGTEVE